MPVWAKFAVCICFFVILNAVVGTLTNYSWWHVALSFTGWLSIGNSAWYMFDTFLLYLLIFACFKLCKFKDIKWNLVILTLAVAVYVVLMYLFGANKGNAFWNTVLCFPLGMWYGYYKENIDKHMRNNKTYCLVTIPTVTVFLVLLYVQYRVDLGLAYVVLSMLFALCVAFISMKIKIGNGILKFFGAHIFSIYILQRIPMIALQGKIENAYLYFGVCFAITVIVAVSFDYVYDKCKKFLTNKICKKTN